MLDRRHFLGAGAAAVLPSAARARATPLSSVSASAALALALQAAREFEDPELLQIGEELAEARERFELAVTARWEAEDAALAAAPAIPDGLAVPFGISIFGSIGWYGLPEPADILGNPIELARFTSPKSGKQLPVRIPTAADIIKDRQNDRQRGRWLGSGTRLPAWQRGEHRRLYDLARNFEDATSVVRETSGLDATENERTAAGNALVEICHRARPVSPKTILGILIKAQAIDGCTEVPGQVAIDIARIAADFLPESICGIMGGVQ